MKSVFNEGDVKIFEKRVLEEDIANFPQQHVHKVYSTFALARDMEWTCRLFALDMIEDGEEGIGTALSIKHVSPAKVGNPLFFEAKISSLKENRIRCNVKVKTGKRLIAIGKTEQKIIKKERLKTMLSNLT